MNLEMGPRVRWNSNGVSSYSCGILCKRDTVDWFDTYPNIFRLSVMPSSNTYNEDTPQRMSTTTATFSMNTRSKKRMPIDQIAAPNNGMNGLIDEEVDENLAFNSDDEKAYGKYFTTSSTSTVGGVEDKARNRSRSISFSIPNLMDPLSGDKPGIKDLPDDQTGISNSSYRDRGFSFEMFSLGINENEELTAPTSGVQVMQGNRMRGDSIIFDPTSFGDGGIHETSALMRMQPEHGEPTNTSQESSHMEPPVTQSTLPNPTPQDTLLPPTAAEASGRGVERKSKSSLPPKKKRAYSPPKKKRAEAKRAAQPHLTANNQKSAPQLASSTASLQQHSSAAQGTSSQAHQQTVPSGALSAATQASSSDQGGDGSAPQPCAMELINKGGRVGIYLPDERKARVAKFHARRKNRIWRKRIKYDCRKKLADSRPRIKGRFVKRSDVE